METSSDLKPGMTYCLHLIPKDENGCLGSPGPDLIVDTETVSCTPHYKSCCILQ